ncbi:MAG: YbhB/YbcL family Raf kinase inhibitor-like protein [Polyangiales bacterium]
MTHSIVRSRSARAFVVVSGALVGACGGTSEHVAHTPTPSCVAPELPLQDHPSAPRTLALASADFEDGGRLGDAQVLNGFGCTGGNHAPELHWSAVPEGTKSFAVVVHDPDAPTGVGFFHWLATDVPAGTTSLPSGGPLPSGSVELHTDFGGPGYGGPCPPPGAPHRYVFTVYALDVDHLGLPPGATGAFVRFAVSQHTLAWGRIVGTYGR